MNKAQEFFNHELSQIENINVRGFAEYVLNNAPAYFFVVPSSSTGKYHPHQHNSKMGLVRHTKALIYFAGILCRAYNVEGKEKDKIVAAGLFHDIVKYSQPMRRHTTPYHDKEGADFVYKLHLRYIEEGNEFSKEDVTDICKAVAFHSGRWTTEDRRKKFPEEYSTIELITHLADVVSSGKEIHLEFLQENLIG